IAGDLQGFTDVFDDGGVNLIDSREVILSVSTVEVVLQRSTILGLRLWRTQGLKAKRGYALSDFVCVATNQFNLWVKHLMNSNEVWSHNVPVGMLQNQMQIVVVIQTSLQLFRELLGINIGQTRNSVLSHNFTISPNEIYCMSILP